MKRRFGVILLIITLIVVLSGCNNQNGPQYKGFGPVDTALTYECPRCGTFTLRVETGKAYGICSRCDEKYYIRN